MTDSTPTWTEPAGSLCEQALRHEARRWHFLHRPPRRLEDWREQRQQLQARIRHAAGIPEHVDVDPAPIYYGTIELASYDIHRLSYQSLPGLRATANLYVPHGDGPFPGIVGVHGHWQQGKVAERVASRGHELAQHGFVVLCVDALGSGERCTVPGDYEYHGAQLGAALLPLGQSLLGLQVIDNMAGVSLLQSLPYVESDKIGVTGASGGGNQTMWLAALDDRIKAAVPVVSVGTFEAYITQHNCVCECLPGGLTFMEEWGAIGLAAPAATLIMNATRDESPAFDIKEMIRTVDDAKRVFALYGEPHRLDYRVFNTPHGYWPPMREAMIGWFKYWLQGEGTGVAVAVAPYDALPEDDLLCFPYRQRSDTIVSLQGWITRHGDIMRQQLLDQPTPAAADLRHQLAELLDDCPHRAPTATTHVRGEDCAHWILEVAPGILLNAHLHGQPTTDLLIAVHEGGRQALLGDPRIQQRLANDQATLLLELSGMGESNWEPILDWPLHSAARASLWLGRSTIGEWLRDLRCILTHTQTVYPDSQPEILAIGAPSLAALALAAITPTTVTLDNLIASLVMRQKSTLSMALFVPRLLTIADIPTLVALAGDSTVVATLIDERGTPLTHEAQDSWRHDVTSWRQRFMLPA